MSGIVGIVRPGGGPVDRALLRRLTEALAFRGPDAQAMWIGRNAGFGHTMLRTTWEAEHEHQPCTLDGEVWIAADARIDDRLNLMDELVAKGRPVTAAAPDAELILHAYHVWGEGCAEHLLGDFAFAIWDARNEHLFCARDHLGIKPFYYFHSGSTFVFSNTLNCLRLYPGVSSRLNEQAIADFLLFDLNQNPATTTFADIHRLPPAHTATLSCAGLHMRRYWSTPVDEPVYYKDSADYVDRFKELLTVAVRDRMRTSWVGIFMSGGIDSPTLAATACRLSQRAPADAVTVFTNVFESLIPDDERYYSGLVASHLGIPIHYRVLDREMLDSPWHDFWAWSPEPMCCGLPLPAERAHFAALSNHGRVFFHGEGPDNALLYEWRAYLAFLARRGRWRRMAADIARHVAAHRRVPLIASAPRMVRDYVAAKRNKPQFPHWLNPGFASRTGSQCARDTRQSTAVAHPVRPRAHASFDSPLWQRLFHTFDPEFTHSPVEVRHPYLDLRLLRYMLAVPVLPWCRKKHLLRSAMRGTLPSEVLRRRKTPLRADALFEAARRKPITLPIPATQVGEYVDCTRVDTAAGEGAEHFWTNLRPVALNSWLHNLNGEALQIYKETGT